MTKKRMILFTLFFLLLFSCNYQYLEEFLHYNDDYTFMVNDITLNKKTLKSIISVGRVYEFKIISNIEGTSESFFIKNNTSIIKLSTCTIKSKHFKILIKEQYYINSSSIYIYGILIKNK